MSSLILIYLIPHEFTISSLYFCIGLFLFTLHLLVTISLISLTNWPNNISLILQLYAPYNICHNCLISCLFYSFLSILIVPKNILCILLCTVWSFCIVLVDPCIFIDPYIIAKWTRWLNGFLFRRIHYLLDIFIEFSKYILSWTYPLCDFWH